MHSDPIADLLTRIRNATMAHHATVAAPWSTAKEDVVRMLTKTGYVASYEVKGDTPVEKRIVISLQPDRLEINLNRISTPGQRIYVDAKHLPNVRRGLGIAIISTSQGLMTNSEAKKANVGGEVLLEVW